jgi:serine/threonine-protein phosphatase 2A regulatory subunit B
LRRRPKLNELYESDCIFDKFRVAASRDGRQIITGSYNSGCKIFDTAAGSETLLELSKAKPKAPEVRRIGAGAAEGAEDDDGGSCAAPKARPQRAVRSAHAYRPIAFLADAAGLDLSKKVLHTSYHPSDDIVAICGGGNLHIYSGR